ncbi:hypothetical protein V1512DRAFT_14239 [Lipomyces arxii]|uniref:uncharacterized protein n=1 Tax=Lipomyces arxii TaxID=56418 RepID=UPI0034CD1AAB
MNGIAADKVDGVGATEKEQEAIISQEEVGWLFVQSYYTYMNKDPTRLHQFYTRRSIMCHGNEGDVVKPLIGQQQINDKISELGLQDCKVLVSNVDSQPSASNGLVIQVLGEMSNRGSPSKKFVQTFFLAAQKAGYYVLNDIFRFLEEDVGSEYEEEELVQIEEPMAAPSSDGYTEKLTTPSIANIVHSVSPVPSSDTPGPESIEQNEATIQEQFAAQNAEPAVFIEEEEKPAVPAHAQESEVDEVPPIPLSPYPAEDAAVTKNAPAPAEAPAAPSGPVSWAALAASRSAAAAASAAPVTVHEPVKTVSPVPAKSVEETKKTVEYHSAYIKGVTDKVNDKALREALAQFGHLKHFEINRQKSCAFVDYADAAILKAALDAHIVTVNETPIYIEERRRGGGNFGNNRTNDGDRPARHGNNRWDRKTSGASANGTQNGENRNRNNRGPASNKRPTAAAAK